VISLDNFISYVPLALQDLKELQAAYAAQESRLERYEEEAVRQLSNQFVETADEEGVKRLESIFSIKPKATDSLSDRRFRILSRINEQLPYTMRRLHQQLVALCGVNGFVIERNSNGHSLTVKVELTAKNNFNDVGNLLEKTVPVNMIINLILRYNQHSRLAQFTHGQLATYSYDHLRNEVLS